MGGMGRGDAAELRGAAMAGAVRAIAGAFVRRRDMGGRARGRDGIAGGVLIAVFWLHYYIKQLEKNCTVFS